MRIALTGATGFIGGAILKALTAQGHQVVAIARNLQRLAPQPGVEPHAFDLERESIPTAILGGADCVFHAAAFIPPNLADASYSGALMRINALGTLTLVQAAREAGVPRFVFISSGNAYVPGPLPVGEGAPQFPSVRACYYLASKLAADIFVAHEGRKGGTETCTLRLGSVYGPGQSGQQVIPRFIARLRSGEGIVLDDDGAFGSDFVHLHDVTQAALAAIERPVSGAYNIGSGVRTTLREVCAILTRILGTSDALVTTRPPLRAPDFGFAPLSIDRAINDLSYQPRGLQDGLMALIGAKRY